MKNMCIDYDNSIYTRASVSSLAGGKSSEKIFGDMRRVPVAVHPIRKSHTELHPKFCCKGPTARSPTDAVIEPHPLISPVTVPRDLLLPLTEGWDARSAATAEVMILFGLLKGIDKIETTMNTSI